MKVFGLILVLAVTACDSGGTNTGSCSAVTTGAEGKNVANTLLLPADSKTFAMDLNGDGKMHNQLGNIISALAAMGGLKPQDAVDKAITAGSVLILLDETASSLTDSSCGQVVFAPGKKAATPPKYDGTDVFMVDPAIGSGTFKGAITAGKFNSNSPIVGDTVLTLQLPLIPMAAALPLTIHGAHLQFTRSGMDLMVGQLNGVIKNSDVQMGIIPAVGQLLTTRINDATANPTTTMQIKSIFDTGGVPDATSTCMAMNHAGCATAAGTIVCKNPAYGPRAGLCSDACDNTIDTCEVSTNAIIKAVLAPDVQMFNSTSMTDSMGKKIVTEGSVYMPTPSNDAKDSLSLGLGFTGRTASF